MPTTCTSHTDVILSEAHFAERRTYAFLRSITALLLIAFAAGATNASAQSAKTQPQAVLNLDAMDPSIDPCVDFFAYSCGGWLRKNPIPPDESTWGVTGKLQDDNVIQLRGILEEAVKANPPKGSPMQKIGDYYASCMDEAALDKIGSNPLQPQLDRIAKLQSKGELGEYLATTTFAPSGSTLFALRSDQDFKDSSQVIAEADQGGLSLPDRDYYLKDDQKSQELRKAYVAHVAKIFELLGDKPADAASQAATVLRIETELAKGQMTPVERRNPQNTYHKMTVAELEKIAPDFNWNSYFAKTATGTQTLNVVAPNYFRTLNAELTKETLADWKTYLRWHAANSAARYLSSAFVKEHFNFYGKTLQGQEQLPPRWKRCTYDVDGDIGEALGQVYVERYFSPASKQAALEMVNQIEAAMGQEIQTVPWMGAATKEQAMVKLHAIANKIGYPDKWRDYSALEIVRGDEFGNVKRADWFEFRRNLAKIGKPVDRGEWGMTPPTVNAYYDPQKNDINFPAGILQPPLYNAQSDAAPNYGDTGGTVGHELTHSFDDEGSQFDAQGNLRNWWTDADRKAFEERAKCVSDQYSQYIAVDDMKVNGQLTNGEDIADLGGTLLAYMAWKDATKSQKLDPIDGLSPEQRFFIGYGQGWCENTRDETRRVFTTVDPHSPPKYRVNGVLSNMPEFREAFHCKPGQPMVRENACKVW
jgi:endothelin-converting enzyme/putative endopeptidase